MANFIVVRPAKTFVGPVSRNGSEGMRRCLSSTNRNVCRAYADPGVDQHCVGAKMIADRGYQSTGLVIPYADRPPAAGCRL